jgi:hypothetical protein
VVATFIFGLGFALAGYRLDAKGIDVWCPPIVANDTSADEPFMVCVACFLAAGRLKALNAQFLGRESFTDDEQ